MLYLNGHCLFLEADFAIKIKMKKQRRFDLVPLYIINCKNINEILTKTLKYLYRKLRENSGKNDKNAKAKETIIK